MTTEPKARVTYRDPIDDQSPSLVPATSSSEGDQVYSDFVEEEERPCKKAALKRVLVRIRSGNGAYSEWMNELKVYLLPNFGHRNVARTHHLRDILSEDSDKTDKLMDELVIRQPNKESARTSAWIHQYKIITKCHISSLTMRNYLIQNTITWPQLLSISIGIMSGLEYLHENHLFTMRNRTSELCAVDAFISGTQGLIRQLDKMSRVYSCAPVYSVSIMHRDLTSHNILLTDKLVPQIANFGSACVYYPMQPANFVQIISGRTKTRFTTSVYSAPEVLDSRAELKHSSMKAIDMYSSGILLWELMSRCVLPNIRPATSTQLKLQRSKPRKYEKPYHDLLGPQFNPSRLRMYVSVYHIRPTVESWWTLGRKTNKFCFIFQELWDNDAEARPSPATVLFRLSRIGASDKDKLNHGLYRMNIKKPTYIHGR